MADIDKITVNNTTYNIKDSTARDSISQAFTAGAYDVDTITTSALLYCVSNSTNTPEAGGVLIASGAGNSSVQLFLTISGTTRIYMRRRVGGSWQQWLAIA